MQLQEAQSKLGDAKKRYLEAEKEIETMRQQIAEFLCPLKVGDEVDVLDNGKSFTGKVEHIAYCSEPNELLGPSLGVKDGWSASGHRINSTTKLIGKWSFSINSFDFDLIGNTWTGRTKSMEEVLKSSIIN